MEVSLVFRRRFSLSFLAFSEGLFFILEFIPHYLLLLSFPLPNLAASFAMEYLGCGE